MVVPKMMAMMATAIGRRLKHTNACISVLDRHVDVVGLALCSMIWMAPAMASHGPQGKQP
jgi:hypothetical protein